MNGTKMHAPELETVQKRNPMRTVFQCETLKLPKVLKEEDADPAGASIIHGYRGTVAQMYCNGWQPPLCLMTLPPSMP
eukprot:1671152-Amphidinium_carterae.1